MKINRTHLFVFVLTVILVIIFLITYASLRPDYTGKRYNFSPFPTVKPTGIPNADIKAIRKCTDEIKPCDPVIGCVNCGDDFECTPVMDGEDVVINGQKLGPGNWCLPSGKRELGCGTYTGRAVWSERNEGGNMQQKWSCVCLYPTLFGGNGCMTQLACKDHNIADAQNANVLKSADGHIWDPNSPNFDPKGRTPYDRDEKGNPLYQCECNANADDPNGVKFVRMPYDPYRCHAEPCTPDHKIKLWNADKQQCDCASVQEGTFVHSNVTGQCLNQSSICTWNDQANECRCEGNEKGNVVQTCESNTMKRSNYTTDPCPDNPGGSYCSNPCMQPDGSSVCLNGGTCLISGNTFKCNCPKEDDRKISGDRCENICVNDGVNVGSNSDASQCCSKKIQQISPHGRAKIYQCGEGSSSSCIGANTIIQTENGLERLGDILPGTKILTWNFNQSMSEYQKLLCLYHHDNTPVSHYKIHIDGEDIILSSEHLIYLSDGTTIQAQLLKPGDKVLTNTEKKFSEIARIKQITDIPLTPVLYQGNVITSKGIVVRCWSGTKENAKLMDNLVELIRDYVNAHTVEESSVFIQETYKKFSQRNKDLSFLLELIVEYKVPVNEQQLISIT